MFQRFRRDVATVLGSLVMALQLTACGIDNDNDQSGDSAVAPAATTIITASPSDRTRLVGGCCPLTPPSFVFQPTILMPS